jgi:epoxyqueuosine reductase
LFIIKSARIFFVDFSYEVITLLFMITNDLTAFLRFRGADLVAFADLSGIPPDVRYALPFGISIAVALNPKIIAGIQDGPTKEYYDEYHRANRLLDSLGQCAAEFLEERGHRAKSFAATDVGIDPKTYSTRLPHKTVATRSGLGWIGKCALLVTEPFGSAVRLTTVLTDAELPSGNPVDASKCGDCRVCVDACPAHAPSGKNWCVALHRDSFYDVFACRKTARELESARIGTGATICGICIAVCPWTRKYITQ